MRQGREMTPYRRGIEEERLRRALYRWYRYGGSYDRIIDLCDVLYATKVAAVLEKFLPKNQRD